MGLKLASQYPRKLPAFNRKTAALVVAAVVVVGSVIVYGLRAATGVVAPAQDLYNLSYATTHNAQKLDLYLPARTGQAVPVVINIHGGAFMEGDKSDEMYNVNAIRSQGWAVANINYRLSGDARFPAGVQDVKAAARWLRAHAAEYGLDTDRFASWGRSAGGYMALALAVTGDQSTTFDGGNLGNSGQSSAVQAVVSLYGVTDFGTMNQQARSYCNSYQDHDAGGSPESIWLGGPIQSSPLLDDANLVGYVGDISTLPAFYFAHGRQDCTVPYPQSQEMYDEVKSRGAAAEIHLDANAGHADGGLDSRTVAPGIAFIKTAFDRIQSTTPTPTPTPTVAPTPAPTATATPGTGGGSLYFNPSSTSVAGGGTFTLEIRENSGSTQVNAVQANVTYDVTRLQYDSVVDTGADFGLSAVTTTSNGQVLITRATAGGTPALSGDKLVAKIVFRALTTAGATSVAFASSSNLVTTAATDILSSRQPATITITGGTNSTPTPTPRPTVTPTPVPTPKPTPTPTPVPLVAGDTNRDGVVNIADLSQLLLSWNSLSTGNDFNRDGVIDVYDLSILLSNWKY